MTIYNRAYIAQLAALLEAAGPHWNGPQASEKPAHSPNATPGPTETLERRFGAEPPIRKVAFTYFATPEFAEFWDPLVDLHERLKGNRP